MIGGSSALKPPSEASFKSVLRGGEGVGDAHPHGRARPHLRGGRRCRGALTSPRSWSSGPGPIVIGQAAEFDYSGTQACRILRNEGLRVILVNSNPATIMTDPEFADATYIEPITPEFVTKIIEQGAPRRAAADPRWPDRAQRRDGPARRRDAGQVRRGADRGEHRGDRARREPRAVQGDRGLDRRRVGPLGDLPHDGRVPRGRRGPRLPGGRAPVVHDGRLRVGHRPRRGRACTRSPAPACRPRRPPRSCSRSRSWAGRSTSSS